MFRPIQGVYVVPYCEKITPVNHKKEKSKEEVFNLATMIHRINKDPKEEEAFYQRYREKKKKQKQSSTTFYQEMAQEILKIKKRPKQHQFTGVEDLTSYIKSIIEEILEAYELIQNLVQPLKELLFEKDLLKRKHREAPLNILELSSQAVSNLKRDLLSEHQKLKEDLSSMHSTLIAKTNECIVKVQQFLSTSSLGTNNEVLQDLFRTLELYEKEYRFYFNSITYIRDLVESYEKDQLLNFFAKQAKLQLNEAEKKQGKQHAISILSTEKQLKFLEDVLKSQEINISERKKSHPHSIRTSATQERVELIKKIKVELGEYKDRLKNIKSDKRDL
ncbi:MAG: hypothetical protein L7U87_05790 [Chlamydiales bacterium]|nr:hypothetical protein [Chlamydiales bacterium]